MSRFHYEPPILERFPGIVGGLLLATGVRNGPTPPSLAEAFGVEQAATRERLGVTPLSEGPPRAPRRGALPALRVDTMPYRSASEATILPLTHQGDHA